MKIRIKKTHMITAQHGDSGGWRRIYFAGMAEEKRGRGWNRLARYGCVTKQTSR